MRLMPLKQWLCDICGEIIETPESGCFEWHEDNKTYLRSGFRIVHRRQVCRYHPGVLKPQNKLIADLNLADLTGADGLAGLLYSIELSEKDIYKIADLREFIEVLRRLHIPYWEEARLYWEKARKDAFHNGSDFSEKTLLSIIREYGEN